jgi:hypothetical protein
MKTTICIILSLLIIPIQIFSQKTDGKITDNKRFLPESKIIKSSINEQIIFPSKLEFNNDKPSRKKRNKITLDNGFLLFEKIEQNWDGSDWVNGWMDTYTYDGNNNLVEHIEQEWGISDWMNSGMWIYTYDLNNNHIESIKQRWEDSDWVNSWKDTYKYDENNNLVQYRHQTSSVWGWYDDWRESYTFDENNNLVQFIYQEYNYGSWENLEKEIYIYDVNNKLIEKILQEWEISAWVNSHKFTYIYNGNNNLVEELNQVWNGYAWVNLNKYVYIYDGNDNLIEKVWKWWKNSEYVNYSIDTYTYDENCNLIEYLYQYCGYGYDCENNRRWESTFDGNNLLEKTVQRWVGYSFYWENFWKEIYNYDVNSNMIEFLYQDGRANSWVNKWRRAYTYIVTGTEQISDEIKSFRLSDNYPNPFNPSTNIEYSIPKKSFVSLQVFDILGREVVKLVEEEKDIGDYKVEFNSSGLSSGAYFYQLKAGDFIETKKMILLK